jgi:LysR family hydrogen peroxide-inducible transcriptional activator
MQFTLRQLSYFKALCEQRNFGRAAEVCHVSQPALSTQIRALEGIMGGELVERRARDISMTPLGREVLDLAEAILQDAAALDRVARDHGAGKRSLALGVIPTIAPYLLPGVLAALRSADLSLTVQVREARTERLVNALIDGALDVAIMALPVSVAGLQETPLFEDRFLLAGTGPRLARIGGADVRPGDLKADQLLLLEEGHCLTDQALEVCGLSPGGQGINMGAGSLGTLSRLVAAGFGLTLMPELSVRSECEAAPDLVVQRFPDPEPARTVGLVRRTTTAGTGWYQDLADIVQTTGTEIVEKSRN